MREETMKELAKIAMEARKNSYSVYSKYSVGSALLCSDGKVYTGTNVENSAYGESICAERVAFCKAISEGKKQFIAIAVCAGKSDGDVCDFAYPCGSCRQVMNEFCDGEFQIILYDGTNVKGVKLGELLPHSFSKSNLE